MRVRPVGALLMKDEAGDDEKIIAVPVDKLHPFYEGVKSYKDLPSTLTDQIAHFFQHYKDLEKGKWVTIVNWVGTEPRREDDPRGHPPRGAAPATTWPRTSSRAAPSEEIGDILLFQKKLAPKQASGADPPHGGKRRMSPCILTWPYSWPGRSGPSCSGSYVPGTAFGSVQ